MLITARSIRSKNVALQLCGRFREFLAALGYMCPAFRAVAIDMHLGVEPSCVIEGTSFYESDPWHDSDFRENWRPTLRAKVALDRLTTVALVVKYLQSSLSFHCRLWNSDQD